MKLKATQTITIPEGTFHQGQEFSTSPDIGERLLAKGHATEPGEIVNADPVVEARDPQPAAKRKRK
jgi:hypothetical protein